MKKPLVAALCALVFAGCQNREKIDFLLTNATVYTVNETFDTAEAIAVDDGKIVAVGNTEDLQEKYRATTVHNASGKTVFPGFIDAHAHFYGLGENQQVVDLVGAKSFEEVLQRVADFQEKHQKPFIEGRGWNQNLWETKAFPTKEKLDSLFPDTPVALMRIDGHAYLANQKALDLAGISASTKMEGGEVVLEEGRPTGILIDAPMAKVKAIRPKLSGKALTNALQQAQDICFSYGLTTINDAGLDREVISHIDSLQQEGALKIRLYAMIANSPENLDYYLDRGVIQTGKLHVRSVKVYGDGALGSRGAALKAPYTDHPNHYGAMVTAPEDIKALAERIAATDFQMNTHAIGDSANSFVLKTYEKVLQGQSDRRWKIEHAQIVSPADMKYFENPNILPSVQSTHATSDMYWAEERIGPERIKGAYAYKELLQRSGSIALGTDFPVEHVSPFYTFYAAVARKDLDNYPKGGFFPEQALTREEALRAMTIWAAHSNFEEHQKGSIEVGKLADFIVLDKNLMTIPEQELPETKVLATFLDGEQVYAP